MYVCLLRCLASATLAVYVAYSCYTKRWVFLLCLVVVACFQSAFVLTVKWSFSGTRFLAVEHSAAERYIGTITDCF